MDCDYISAPVEDILIFLKDIVYKVNQFELFRFTNQKISIIIAGNLAPK